MKALTKTTLVLMAFALPVAHAANIKCPVPNAVKNLAPKKAIATAYAVMRPNTVWPRILGGTEGIVFRDQMDRGFIESKDDYDHWNGVFKINYGYSAKECRRQIFIDKELTDKKKNPTGIFTGWMIVDVC